MAQPGTPPTPVDGAVIVYDAATGGVVCVPLALFNELGYLQVPQIGNGENWSIDENGFCTGMQQQSGPYATMPELYLGELFWTTDTHALYIGTNSGNVQIWPASGGGGGNKVQATVDFGFEVGEEGDAARITVTGQSWVSATSIIVCSPAGVATATHDPEDAALEGIVAYAENLVPGTGFDIIAKACGDSGTTWGQYVINAIGL